MTKSNEQSPNYSIELEVEVPGTPEQVWNAIATGPGIAAWFVPPKSPVTKAARSRSTWETAWMAPV